MLEIPEMVRLVAVLLVLGLGGCQFAADGGGGSGYAGAQGEGRIVIPFGSNR
jgi:hypothetical protein